LEDLDLDECQIKIDIKEVWCEDLNLIDLAHDRMQWRILFNTVKGGPLTASEEGFFAMELVACSKIA